MDLNAIGVNRSMIDGSAYRSVNKNGIRKSKAEAEKEQTKPKDKNTSIANDNKGRIIDVAL